jgi:hypothetical protein
MAHYSCYHCYQFMYDFESHEIILANGTRVRAHTVCPPTDRKWYKPGDEKQREVA